MANRRHVLTGASISGSGQALSRVRQGYLNLLDYAPCGADLFFQSLSGAVAVTRFDSIQQPLDGLSQPAQLGTSSHQIFFEVGHLLNQGLGQLSLRTPRPRPVRNVVILGAQHENDLENRGFECDQPRTTCLRILLEDYTDTYGRIEQRLAAYEMDAAGNANRRIGYLPKDAPRREGQYLAILRRLEGKRRLVGTLSLLR